MHRSITQAIRPPRRALRCRLCGHGFDGVPMDNLPLSETRWHGECPRCRCHVIEGSRDAKIAVRLDLAREAEARGRHDEAAEWRREAQMIERNPL